MTTNQETYSNEPKQVEYVALELFRHLSQLEENEHQEKLKLFSKCLQAAKGMRL